MSEYGRSAPQFPRVIRVGIGVLEPDKVCKTTMVSRYGAHLDLDPGVDPGSLVWLHMELPTGDVVEATGVVARAQRQEGCELEFSMFLRGTRVLWEEWIDSIEEDDVTDPGRERRMHGRSDVGIIVQIDGEARFTTESISAGGMLVRSAEAIPLGTEVEVLLVHPTTQQTLALTAKVVRHDQVDEQSRYGLALQFMGASGAMRKVVSRFVEHGTSE